MLINLNQIEKVINRVEPHNQPGHVRLAMLDNLTWVDSQYLGKRIFTNLKSSYEITVKCHIDNPDHPNHNTYQNLFTINHNAQVIDATDEHIQAQAQHMLEDQNLEILQLALLSLKNIPANKRLLLRQMFNKPEPICLQQAWLTLALHQNIILAPAHYEALTS